MNTTNDLRSARPTLWINPGRTNSAPAAIAFAGAEIGPADMQAAQARFERFAPLLSRLFPELEANAGRIESTLTQAPHLATAIGLAPAQGSLWIKQDHALPIAGSIKARGGVHEVLEFAERIALEKGLLQGTSSDDYPALAEPAAREVFSRYSVAVGSTGNLGLSIGVIAWALGFKASVHMSADAKAWKKTRLRSRGVNVVEHAGDYAQAVAQGRSEAAADAMAHFVDDERSLSLFLGYAAAAFGLKQQIANSGLHVDAEHPLFVYLPCGVGGAPGGIAFGLRHVFGPHAHCFFAEPVQSPCMLVQMMDGSDDSQGKHPTVYDYGLTNQTEADGLAVPQASLLASTAMRGILGGIYTVRDDDLMAYVYQLEQTEGLRIEPSATAGIAGPHMLLKTDAGRRYLETKQLSDKLPHATHIIWTTGGLFVPPEQYQVFWNEGERIATSR